MADPQSPMAHFSLWLEASAFATAFAAACIFWAYGATDGDKDGDIPLSDGGEGLKHLIGKFITYGRVLLGLALVLFLAHIAGITP